MVRAWLAVTAARSGVGGWEGTSGSAAVAISSARSTASVPIR